MRRAAFVPVVFALSAAPVDVARANGDVPRSVPLNRAFCKASHNTYDPTFGGDVTVGASLRSGLHAIEWDLADHTFTRGRWGLVKNVVARDWYVAHDAHAAVAAKHCGGRGMLSDCLAGLRAWHVAPENQGHRPIWVFIDKKQRWNDSDRRPADLDALIASWFSPAEVFRPVDLYAGTPHAHPRAAARASAWPMRDALRGKVAFVLTGDNDHLATYADARRAAAWAFVAPTATDRSHVTDLPPRFTRATAGWVAMYNFEWSSPSDADGCSASRCAQLPLASAHGYLTRAWDVEDAGEFAAAVNARAHFVAVDLPVLPDPGMRTSGVFP